MSGLFVGGVAEQALDPASVGVRLPPAFVLHAFDSVASTNDVAKRLAAAGAEDGTLIWARAQTAGRGRDGRVWASPPGNLHLSIVMRPDQPPRQALQLSFVVAVALAAALADLIAPMLDLRLKWPNDVLIGDRKCAGILLESQLSPSGAVDWLVAGVGVNVRLSPADAAFPATHLAACGAECGPEEVLEAFASQLLRWCDLWLHEGFAPVRAQWMSKAWRLDQPITARLPGGVTLDGINRGIDADGRLMLETAEGMQALSAADVFPPEAFPPGETSPAEPPPQAGEGA